MKFWKKILIAVVILGVLFVRLLGYGTYKAVNGVVEWMEPRIEQYVTLDEEMQNKFVMDNIDELMKKFTLDTDSAEDLARWEKMKSDPEFRDAAVQWGRSAFASIIVDSEAFSAKVSPEQLAKYKKEASEREERNARFDRIIKKYDLEKQEK